jgi:hypothetical protein
MEGKEKPMAGAKTMEAMREEFERLKGRLRVSGPVLQGSILARALEREDPRAPGRMRQYGPYYQWTRKISGRTVNVNLSAAQAKVFGRAIARHRRLEELLERMRVLSLNMLEISTVGVRKRKSRKTNDLALS